MTEETPYETRFFTVTLDASGAVTNVNTGRIAAVTEEQAQEMVQAAEAKGSASGYDGNYKYLKAAKPTVTAAVRNEVFKKAGLAQA